MQAETPQTVHVIDFGSMVDRFMVDARRVAFFVGVAQHAAENDAIGAYQMARAGRTSALEHVPSGLSAEKVREGRHEMADWVLAQGLRDLVEAFEKFMEAPFSAAMLAARIAGVIDAAAEAKWRKEFDNVGLHGKCKVFADVLGIAVPGDQHFATLNRYRNCLTHRRGFVHDIDCDAGTGHMSTTWRGFDLILQLEDGRELSESEFMGRAFDVPGHIVLRFVNRSKAHPVGARATFSVEELSELVFTFTASAREFAVAAIARLVELGVKQDPAEVAPVDTSAAGARA